MKQHNFRTEQRGNVMFFIFVAIVLFAALSFSVSDMLRSGSADSISTERSKIVTSDVIDYARSIRQAVQTLRINGCDETELSFEKAPFDGSDTDYVNAASPADFSCHIFHPSGGAMNYVQAPTELGTNLDWFFGVNRVGKFDDSENIGTSAVDLTMILLDIGSAVCDQFNETLNGYSLWESSNTPNTTIEFDGDYAASSLTINRANNATPESGCFCDDAGGTCSSSSTRYFYSTLLKR